MSGRADIDGPKVLISACLLGQPVRYDGGHRKLPHDVIEQLRADGRLVPVCPEMLGGLPTLRPAAEIVPPGDGNSVLDKSATVTGIDGTDQTDAFVTGAEATLKIAQETGCRFAILTEKSPSCGTEKIHTGAFDGVLRSGQGVTAALLARNGITVISSEADLNTIDLTQD